MVASDLPAAPRALAGVVPAARPFEAALVSPVPGPALAGPAAVHEHEQKHHNYHNHHHRHHHHNHHGHHLYQLPETRRAPAGPGGWDRDGVFHAAESTAGPAAHGTTASLVLSNKSLVAVDLTGLPPLLNSLSVAANALPAIDLAPLRTASTLTALILNANALAAVDLSPLASAPALERLWLHNNSLTTIDLAPLAHCQNLRSLYLDANRIDVDTVDLAPLAACKLLRALRLGKNALGGQLDITPILGCSALSTLDVSASVKLSALVVPRSDNPAAAVAAPGTLPPALRRRAATVHWIADEEDDEDEEENEGSENQDDPAIEVNSFPSPAGQLSIESSGKGTPSVVQDAFPRSPSLEELASLCSRARRVPGTHAALLVGFRGTSRFATEALLAEHGGLATAVVSSPEACSAEALAGVGAFSSCCVVVVHPDPELVADLRAFDSAIPIVVVGNAVEAAEQASRCLRKGASCFFTEPLDARDALALRSLAHQRLRLSSYPRRRSPSPPTSAMLRKQDHDPPRGTECVVRSPSCSSLTSLCSSSGSSPWRPLSPGCPGSALCPPMSPLSLSPPELPPSSFVEKDERMTRSATVVSQESRGVLCASRTIDSPLVSDSASVPAALSLPKSLPCVLPPRTPKRSSSRRLGSHARARCTIDFRSLRARVDGITTSRTNRVEDSAISMLFSRCGGRAFLSDFGSIATLCGLPVCSGAVLHAAAKRWMELSSCQKLVTPSLSPVSIMEFGGQPETPKYASARSEHENPHCDERVTNSESGTDCRNGGSLSGVRSISAMKEILEQPEVERRQTEGLSYETFHDFWTQNLCNRDCETRLFNVLRVAHRSECAVPVVAIRDLATALVSCRGSDMCSSQMRNLAASLLCYELKGISWQWIGRHELRQARLCGSLLAAESGMYNGVAASLRSDRMSDIRMAFAAASGRRVGGSTTLSVKDIIWLNAERSLLTPRAVEAVFEREVGAGGMDLARFAPMWLAVTNPDTRSSCEYLFGILDADADGYINAMDVAHFYMEKRRLLLRDGYIPTAFEHVWRGLLDSVSNGKMKSPTGRLQVSLTDLRLVGPRDWTVLFQSLLFMDDDMAMVDLVKTSLSGSAAASAAVAALS